MASRDPEQPPPRRTRVASGSADSAVASSVRTERVLTTPPLQPCELAAVDSEKVARARHGLPPEPTLARLGETLRALGDATRLRIVAALAADGVGELCVCELASLVEVTDSAVSHSLRVLRDLGIVRARKVGKTVYYALDDAHVEQLVAQGLRHVQHIGR